MALFKSTEITNIPRQWTARRVIKLICPTATQANQARAATSSPTTTDLRYNTNPRAPSKPRKRPRAQTEKHSGAKQADEATSVTNLHVGEGIKNETQKGEPEMGMQFSGAEFKGCRGQWTSKGARDGG
jgi:hypothetical protein